ncbi:MAG TPA: hypothetical protein VF457_05270 [Burkholderiaceae bacterium]
MARAARRAGADWAGARAPAGRRHAAGVAAWCFGPWVTAHGHEVVLVGLALVTLFAMMRAGALGFLISD